MHTVVDEVRTFLVDSLGVLCDDVRRHVACDVQDALVVLNRIFIVHRRVSMCSGISIITLFQFYDAFHQRVFQMERYFRVVSIIIHKLKKKASPPTPLRMERGVKCFVGVFWLL